MEHHKFEYFSNDDFLVEINEAGGHAFLHLEMHKWSKSALKELRLVLDLLEVQYRDKGHDVLFATTDNEKVVKFWNLVRPCDILQKFGPRNEYYIGSWIIMEEEDGD